jgi:hypothetical protein
MVDTYQNREIHLAQDQKRQNLDRRMIGRRIEVPPTAGYLLRVNETAPAGALSSSTSRHRWPG